MISLWDNIRQEIKIDTMNKIESELFDDVIEFERFNSIFDSGHYYSRLCDEFHINIIMKITLEIHYQTKSLK